MNCIVNVQKHTNENNSLSLTTDYRDESYLWIERETTGSGNAKVGVELAGACWIRGGIVCLYDFVHPANTASGNPSECIWVRGFGFLNQNSVIETQLVDSQGIDGAVGIRIKDAVQGLKIDITTQGFHDPNSRLLIVDNPSDCTGLDITIRCGGNEASKSFADYVDIGSGWQGSTLRFFDQKNGTLTQLESGVSS